MGRKSLHAPRRALRPQLASQFIARKIACFNAAIAATAAVVAAFNATALPGGRQLVAQARPAGPLGEPSRFRWMNTFSLVN